MQPIVLDCFCGLLYRCTAVLPGCTAHQFVQALVLLLWLQQQLTQPLQGPGVALKPRQHLAEALSQLLHTAVTAAVENGPSWADLHAGPTRGGPGGGGVRQCCCCGKQLSQLLHAEVRWACSAPGVGGGVSGKQSSQVLHAAVTAAIDDGPGRANLPARREHAAHISDPEQQLLSSCCRLDPVAVWTVLQYTGTRFGAGQLDITTASTGEKYALYRRTPMLVMLLHPAICQSHLYMLFCFILC